MKKKIEDTISIIHYENKAININIVEDTHIQMGIKRGNSYQKNEGCEVHEHSNRD